MTSMTTLPGNQRADLQQLVLFPEVVDAGHLQFDRLRTTEAAQEGERKEDSLSFQQALDTGQLPLFA